MNLNPVSNPTPKARFQESADSISKHRDLVDSTTFQRASDYAMLEYAKIMALESVDGNTAVATAMRLRGAHEYLQIFRNLSEKSEQLKAPPAMANLNHRA